MKAVLYKNYGGPEVLHISNIKKPTPDDDEILVKIYASSVTAGDTRMRSFNVPKWQWLFARIYLGIFKPKKEVLGMELSGEIEAIGKNVKHFNVGDQVFASTLDHGFGGYAEYKCIPENGSVALMPKNLDHIHAATIPIGGGTALRFLRKENIKAGQNILIYGASGSVGTYAIQLAKYFDAYVTAVCSTSNLELAKSLGADKVIDYTKEDFTNNGKLYDIIFDAVGKSDASQAKSVLKNGGRFLSVFNNPGKTQASDLNFLSKLVEAGKIKPVVERVFTIDQIIDAHQYVDSGHKKGNVAVKIVS